MATIVTRSGKGSPLTHGEVDSNFTNLNTDKLETAGGSMTGNLSFGDNDKAIFGAGSDLQIYHDGSNSFIVDSGTGLLAIRGSTAVALQGTNGENAVIASENGAVDLRYDNSTKLATTSTGVDITGTLTSDGLTLNDGSTDVQVNSSSTNARLDFIASRTSSNLASFRFKDNQDRNKLNIDQSGDISFYEDTGTTAKFFWDASAESLGIGTSSPSALLNLSESKSTAYDSTGISSGTYNQSIVNTNTDANTGAFLALTSNDNGSGTAVIGSIGGTTFKDSQLVFLTRDGSASGDPIAERMRIDSIGRVGIGTSSPSAGLHIESGNAGAPELHLVTGNKIGASGTLNFGQWDGTTYTERMRIDSSGNVGIGTSSPDNSLHVLYANSTAYSNATSDSGIQIQNTVTTTNAFSQLHFRTGNSDSYIRSIREGDNLASLAFLTDDGGATGDVGEAMRIDSSGLVGIGTSSPAAPLEVSTSSADYRIQLTHASGQNKIKSLDGDQSTFRNLIYDAAQHMFETSGSEAMRIDSSGNLLVGTTDSTPYNNSAGSTADNGIALGGTGIISSAKYNDATINLNRTGTDGDIAVFRKDGTTVGSIGSNSSGGQPLLDINASTAGSSQMRFTTSNTEAMRIDSSGNLLVGKTSTGINTAGSRLIGGGAGAQFTADGTEALALNRIGTSDGDLIWLGRSGAKVGSIGATGGDLFVGTGDAGLWFQDGGNAIRPFRVDTQVGHDASIDLGHSSNRFKDLYLSGGVYLGGTGAANKLDDYEEGTFTPTMEFGGSSTGVTYGSQEGVYTKVGRLVTCFIRLGLTSNGSLSGSAQIRSLPFTVGNVLSTTSYQGGSHMVNVSNATGTSESFTAVPNEGTSGLIIGRVADSAGNSSYTTSTSQITNTFDFRLTVTYMVA